MSLQNTSIKVTHFIIGGFDTVKRPVAVGVVMLITYLLAVIANVLNIVFIIFDKRLHKPMYLLICNLAVVDLLYTSSTCPTMIGVLLAGVNTISYVDLMAFFALAFMAFDRLIAIIYPFQYHSYMTNTRTLVVTYILWVVSLGVSAVMPVTAATLPYCTSRMKDKKKMASTCMSHLIVVTCYYSPLFVLIVFTRVGVVLTLEERQGLLIGNILGPAVVNPFVYCFRTKEIKNKIFKIFTKNGI
ncbi:carboxypeptidase N regulatory subunit [Sarotherodon galilaeus]